MNETQSACHGLFVSSNILTDGVECRTLKERLGIRWQVGSKSNEGQEQCDQKL